MTRERRKWLEEAAAPNQSSEGESMRTDNEVLKRVRELSEHDFFGFATGDLICTLPYDLAKEFLRPDVKAEDWKPSARDRESVLKEMREYMPFAIEKAIGHRGISASRSVSHYRAWIWLLGDEDFAAIDWERYSRYGAPILKAICDRYGLPSPDHSVFVAQAAGNVCPRCQDGSQSGCQS